MPLGRFLETRDATSENDPPENIQPVYQYLWSRRYIDAPILRDQNIDTDGLCDDERIYFANDPSANITTLIANTTGAPTERYVYTPYGSAMIFDSTWTTTRALSEFGNVLHLTGQMSDPDTGISHFRRRYYPPQPGLFASRDHWTARPHLYLYLLSRPGNVVDPFGLTECNCPPDACEGLMPINRLLSDKINDEIRQAIAVARRHPTKSFEHALWDGLAEGELFTVIETWIRSRGGTYVARGRRMGALLPPVLARCILIDCGEGKRFCIGDDKLGHFFQQGHLLYEFKEALRRRFRTLAEEVIAKLVEDFSGSTEGFDPSDPKMYQMFVGWMEVSLLVVDFYGFLWKEPHKFWRRWGGFPGAARSRPDLAANRGGLRFWEEIMRRRLTGEIGKFTFDICDYVDASWLEFTAAKKAKKKEKTK